MILEDKTGEEPIILKAYYQGAVFGLFDVCMGNDCIDYAFIAINNSPILYNAEKYAYKMCKEFNCQGLYNDWLETQTITGRINSVLIKKLKKQ
jgi:hypothetical protein